ncbi:hypothetical protein SBF1_5130010 [Candidatus Desulfosporosinus infrequens]|uniref:Uncharacterized protein n=1 Tax=Candidatus Desulfosporosinus infrequens TaxID=2043169 RepID=A0A2U3LI13_9FIRM|nr:hypothetical protein SBF1_5130010 [Candidatus Desulfosporosinus infrequens]
MIGIHTGAEKKSVHISVRFEASIVGASQTIMIQNGNRF